MEEIRSLIGLSPVYDIAECGLKSGVVMDDEDIKCMYKGVRDSCIITSKRIFVVNKQGLTGKKQDYLSIPLSKIQAYSFETAGTLDLDSELTIYVSGMGSLKIRITRPTTNIDQAISALNQMIL